MDSHLMTNILNTNLAHTDDKLDQQTIRSPDSNQQRSSSNSGESDVDSGIVAIEHNLSRISSGQLPISCDLINRYQLDHSPNSQFDFRTNLNIHYHQINLNNLSENQPKHLNHQLNHPNHLNNHHPNEHHVNNHFNETHLNTDNQLLNSFHHSNILSNHFTESNYITPNYSSSNHLNDIFQTSEEQDSEHLRKSCRKILAKINSTQPLINDAIYANVNSVDRTKSNSELIRTQNVNSNLNVNLNSAIDALTNCVQQGLQVNETTNQYAVPVLINCECLNCAQNKRNKLLNPSQQLSTTNFESNINSNGIFNYSSNNNSTRLNEATINRVSISNRSIGQESNLVRTQFSESTNVERRVNQEDIKRLLLEALRQKNLEKEALEEKERQLNMYLIERQKVLRERELENGLNKMNLNEDTCDALNGNNLMIHDGIIHNVMTHDTTTISQNVTSHNVLNDQMNNGLTTNVQYENTPNVVLQVPKQATLNQYQNVPFHQSINLNNNNPTEPNNNDKLNEFTKSCIVQTTTTPEVDNSADELITKSFNGGYCSQQTRKILEGRNYGGHMKNNFKKPETKSSIFQKFSSKFSRALTKAFFVEKGLNKTDSDKSCIDKKTTESALPAITEQSNELTTSSLDKTSNFIEKIKSIDTTRSIQETNNKLKNKIETCVDTLDSSTKNANKEKVTKVNKGKQEKKRIEINLDEFCVIKKPDLTPRKYSIDDDKKRCSIKKRNSMSRKNCLNKSPSTNGLPTKCKSRHHKVSRHQVSQSNEDASTKDEHVSAELVEIHKDGTQVIEIIRKPKRHFGFFFARGKVKQVNGVYVSRMRDEETKRLLTGLLEVGDQILAIDGVSVGDSSIIEVNYLMTNKTCIKLHVKPYTKS